MNEVKKENQEVLAESTGYDMVYANNEPVSEMTMKGFPTERIGAVIYFLKNTNIPCGKDVSVLDIGCGNGQLLFNLKSMFGKLCGIEFSKNRAAHAADNLKGYDSEIICDDFLLHNFNRKFNILVSADVVEHVPDVFGFFKKANELLNIGGYFVLNTPNVMYLRYRMQFVFGRFPSTALKDEGMSVRAEGEMYDAGHLHYFNYSVLRKMARKFGFEVIQETGIGRLGRLHNIYPPLTSGSCNMMLRKVKDI